MCPGHGTAATVWPLVELLAGPRAKWGHDTVGKGKKGEVIILASPLPSRQPSAPL